jgi:hypothetical protein
MGKEAKDAGGDLEDLSDSFDDISDATGEGADAAEEFEPHYYSGTYLDVLVKNEAVQHYIKDYSFVQRYESVRDHEQKTVPIHID